ncbi:MAG: hypothetical protein AAGU11_16205 [Syntrophobacteraceae bacterium]
MKLTPEGLKLIVDWEVGGKAGYERKCRHPLITSAKIKGLRDRREVEARHIERGLAKTAYDLPEGAELADQDWTTPGFFKRSTESK